ncbi:tetratricopeptide repeat protein [Hassallia byssoidea VB512170]|uniref:Tetratricopeptide repeat protein n=1 Tax=Hassallia byssoidea VB512170 TaxID=1304833 RepID=A0A846GZL9_9CYAN|nr:tetratricopeptide repeat protein [Hassalia byssoidea]NEU71152.1 tetratricopeptide repeat protein [Hassalia byssoidea VB512170]
MTNNENWQGLNIKGGSVSIHNPNFHLGQSQRTPPPNPIKYIPNRGVANFVGRQQELTTLHEKLQQPGTVAISAIAGMGGIGKTELATQYALQYQQDYPGGICWLNAKKSNLAAEIIEIVQLHMQEVPQKQGERPLTLQEQVAWYWQNWQPAEKLVLVVLDDVTDENWQSCQTLLPTTNRFRVLLTTRLRNLDNVQEIPLNVLPPDKALELLTLNGEKSVDAEKLCEWLGYLPLGLQLVRRYLLENPDLSLAEMLQRLQAQRLEDEAINFSTRGVKAAFELSWQQLNPITQRVAAYLSLFAPDVISWKWVESATDLLNCTESDINEAKKQLYKRYLIERLQEKQACYKIHPLIREFLKAKLAALENTDDLRRNFAAVFIEIAQEIPETPTLEDIKSVQDAIPHLTEVAQNLIDAVSDEDLGSVFLGLGRFYEGQGLYAIAEPWYKQCVEVVKASLGEEHPDVAMSLNNLALLYSDQGRYSDAEPLLIQALELNKRLLGEEHPDVATSLNNLALLYSDQGRYSDAEPLYIQALALRKRLLGEEHPHVATSLNNLALLYNFQGRYSEAEPLYIQALALRKRLLGEEHPDVAISLNNLAGLYNSQGRYSEAEPLYIQALALRKRLLGEEHPDVAMSLNNLAGLYNSQGRYSEAEPLYIQALALFKRLLGEEHPHVAMSLNNLALLYSDQGRYSEAEPLYIQALALRERVLGFNHPNTVTVRENLADLRAEISASHENVTNSSTEEKTSNSWWGRLLEFLWG